ncbi:hypothetical protein HY501_01355 [Candidatus Woesearchaeota archaeon]|nr:hypothetical protein [Candidatus Woesearchaeota archaeon]
MEQNIGLKNAGLKDYLLLIMVAAVLALTIAQSFQIKALKLQGSSVVTGAAGGIDMAGWTEDEKMMYEHHGTMPARLSGGASSASGGMVGGC